MTPWLPIIIAALASVILFVAGLFFGAYLQRRVACGRDIRLPNPLGRSKASVVTDDDQSGYVHPYRTYEH